MGWWLLRLTVKILALLRLMVNFFLLRSLKNIFLRLTLFETNGWNSSIFTPNSNFFCHFTVHSLLRWDSSTCNMHSIKWLYYGSIDMIKLITSGGAMWSSLPDWDGLHKGSSTFDKQISSYKLHVYTGFWIRARYDTCRALTHQGCKWIQLNMSDKIPEFYPLQYRALDACANPKYCNLRVPVLFL